MLIPIFGELISSAGLALNVYFDYWPMEIAGKNPFKLII
jgi:hypothetical protein